MDTAAPLDGIEITVHTSSMESTRPVEELAHVLRHSFQPNEWLIAEIEGFLRPGIVNAQPLLSTRAVFIPANDFYFNKSYHYAKELRLPTRNFERARDQLTIDEINYDKALFHRQAGALGLRLLFKFSQESARTFRHLQAPLLIYDQATKPQLASPHYDLYVDISKNHVAPSLNPDEVVGAFNTLPKAKKALFQVATRNVVGRDVPLVARKPRATV